MITDLSAVAAFYTLFSFCIHRTDDVHIMMSCDERERHDEHFDSDDGQFVEVEAVAELSFIGCQQKRCLLVELIERVIGYSYVALSLLL